MAIELPDTVPELVELGKAVAEKKRRLGNLAAIDEAADHFELASLALRNHAELLCDSKHGEELIDAAKKAALDAKAVAERIELWEKEGKLW